MAKKTSNQSKYLSQINKESDEQKHKLFNKDDVFVEDMEFKSKTPNKENQTLYVSKINKPAPLIDNPNFFQKLMFRFGKDNTSGMAAQLAYYFLLAIFPLLIFLLTLLPLFQIDQESLTGMIRDYIPSDIAGTLEGIITDVMASSNGGLLSFGLIATLWSASNGMTALMNAFNVAYDVEDNRNFLVAKGLSLVFTVILALSVLLTFVLVVFGGQIGTLLFDTIGLGSEFETLWSLVRNVLPVILVFVVFSVMYLTAPNIKLDIKSILPGAVFTTVMFLVASWGFSFYVSNFGNYSATYGSLAGAIILVFWLYITGVIIILGAQINAIMHVKHVVNQEDEE
ncbi:YihY/virulence factor BrkB family protein [Corticicoccus populi]|uniref:YihY/virulence factor BrkB family protein n=1 Tax=Corticicoccus populi TaxID=1812821 RepID=A0ABW5X1L5_9STAP